MLEELVGVFCEAPSERRITFRSNLEKCLADPRRSDVHVSFSNRDNHLALVAVSSLTDEELVLPLVRHTKRELGPTVLRHQLMSVVRGAIAKNARLLRVIDTGIPASVEAALEEIGFRKVSGSWLKPLLSGIVARDEILSCLSRLNISLSPSDDDSVAILAHRTIPQSVGRRFVVGLGGSSALSGPAPDSPFDFRLHLQPSTVS